MSYSYDITRELFVVRTSINGQRHFIGRYETEEKALQAEVSYLTRIAKAEHDFTLEKYKVLYEYENTSVQWLKKFRAFKTKLENKKKQQKLDRETAHKIEMM